MNYVDDTIIVWSFLARTTRTIGLFGTFPLGGGIVVKGDYPGESLVFLHWETRTWIVRAQLVQWCS
jgi:hypothetical protein